MNLNSLFSKARYYKTITDSVRDREDLEFEIFRFIDLDRIPERGWTMKLSIAVFPLPIIINPSCGSHKYSSTFSLQEASAMMVSLTEYAVSLNIEQIVTFFLQELK